MVRAFIALELPGEIRERLKEAQETLRSCSARLTFVEPELIHITLKFLGEVEEKDLPQVIDALKERLLPAVSRYRGNRDGEQPETPAYGVVYYQRSEVRGKNSSSQVEEVLAPLGFERETRGFTPHATLARVKVPDPSLFTVLRALEGTDLW